MIHSGIMHLLVGKIRVPVTIALCNSPPEGVPEDKVTAAAEPDDDEKIPHATLEVYRHTLLRGANTGSFLTLVIGFPVLFFRGVRQPAELIRRLARASTKGVGIGMGAVALMTMMKLRDQTEEQIFDRAYRLRYNKGQCRLDKITYGSVVIGGLLGMGAMPGALAAGGIQGACFGAGLAVFLHALTNRKAKEE